MEFDRAVQVRARGLDGRPSFGSGYLVGPRLVLTAAHVIRGGAPTVCRPDAGPVRWDAVVRWQRYDEVVDAALLEIPDAGWPVPESLADVRTQPPQRWGRLATTLPGRPATARGFPRLQKEPAGRWDELLSGTISRGTGDLARRYEILGQDALPARGEGGHLSSWAGMSGAAVFVDDLLVGVVRRDRRAENGTRLTATRTDELVVDEEFAACVHDRTGWAPRAEAAELTGLIVTGVLPERDLRSPAMLLRADVEAVGFYGRADEIELLTAWCASPERLSIRVLTGPSGQGKTRLARRLVELRHHEGWVAGHLRADVTDDPNRPDPDVTPFRHVDGDQLIVVDYAEARPRQVRRIIDVVRRGRRKVRLLLVARTSGPWRTEVRQADAVTHELLASAPEIELGPPRPPDDPDAARRDLRALAGLLGEVPGHENVDWTEHAASVPASPHVRVRSGSPLEWQMAALVSLLQAGPDPAPASPNEPVEATLLRHEERYWGRTASSFRLDDLTSSVMERIVAAAVLCGALDEDEALATVARIPGTPPDKRYNVAEWLRQLYPPARGFYWGTIQPDRVAEFYIAAVAASNASFVPKVVGAASPGRRGQALTVLARAVVGEANAGRDARAAEVLRRVEGLLDEIENPPAVLEGLLTAMPRPSEFLTGLAVRLTTDLTAAYREAAATYPDQYEPKLAETLGRHAITLREAGRKLSDLAAAEESVSLYRHLARKDPDTFGPLLANALTNLSVSYRTRNRAAEAVELAVQARDLLRSGADDSASHLEMLYSAVAEIAIANMEDDGNPSDALAAAEEAVEIHRRLPISDPESRIARRATPMFNLASIYFQFGRTEEAAELADEVIAGIRPLARLRPDSYTNLLSSALDLSAHCHRVAGRREEALSAAREALREHRKIVERNRAAHLDMLVARLNTLLLCAALAGDRVTALALQSERDQVSDELKRSAGSVDLTYWMERLQGRRDEADALRARIEAERDRAEPSELAESHVRLAELLGEIGMRDDAVAEAERAVARYRECISQGDGAVLPRLVSAVNVLASRYGEVGHWPRMREAAAEAESLGRLLQESNEEESGPLLADALWNSATACSRLGDAALSLQQQRESVAVLRALPPAPPLMERLEDLAESFAAAGDLEAALAAMDEAVTCYRRLPADTWAPSMAEALGRFAALCSRLRRHTEALAACQESIAICRPLADRDLGAHGKLLGDLLRGLAVQHTHLGSPSKALAAAQESVDVFRQVPGRAPGESPREEVNIVGVQSREIEATHPLPEKPPPRESLLAPALITLSACYSDLGRIEEAVVASEEAIANYRKLASAEDGYHFPLALTLTETADRYVAAGQAKDALAALREAADIYRGQTREGEFHSEMVRVDYELAKLHLHTGQLDACLARAQSAVQHYQALADRMPDEFVPRLRAAADLLITALERSGRHEEASWIRRRFGRSR
ncbi:tetratricopeptide repeat protein [Actinomadura soli]|uniref:Tetratricopeptide repeat protein n=1 Tax=Actinomadura soli TaxID=2508997 RepID=A0A5C4JJ42_9ACTN|nr:trypsin-like peptidase domain-containing protein [Actinomadura soli]TMR06426.1 tetratricopeptide repeat protein [Actinomadura soli]